MQCTATSKHTGNQCRAAAIIGKRTCRVHGGVSPVGPASPHFKTGRHSKHLPTHLLTRYQAARSDPDLLVQRDEVALIDIRLAELVTRLGDTDNAARWTTVRLAFGQYQTALRTAEQDDAKDEAAPTVAARLADLQAAIWAGQDDDRVWVAIGEQIEARRKVVESERKRLVELQQVITLEQALTFATQLAMSVRQHVNDRSALVAISADIDRLLHTTLSIDPAR